MEIATRKLRVVFPASFRFCFAVCECNAGTIEKTFAKVTFRGTIKDGVTFGHVLETYKEPLSFFPDLVFIRFERG